MDAKFTPGPWAIVVREVLEDGSVFPRHIVAGERKELVCYLEGQVVADIAVKKPGTHWDTTPKKEANARLIEAAPELLEALVRLVGSADSAAHACNTALMDQAIDLGRDAIARATGAAQ